MIPRPSVSVFLVAAKELATACWRNVACLERQIFNTENIVLNSTKCDAKSWYFLGLPFGVTARFISQEGQDVTGAAVVLKPSLIHRQKAMTRIKLSPGKYSIEVSKNEGILRTIEIVAHKRRRRSVNLKRQGADMTILVPDTAIWMKSRVHSLLTQQQFSFVDAGSGINVYQRTLTNQYTIAVLTYGSKCQDQLLANYLRLSTEALMLLERDDPFESVCMLDSVVKLMNFTVKCNDSQRCTVTPDTLKEREWTIMKLLRAISMTNKMVVSAAKVGNTACNRQSLDYLVSEWIALPSSFVMKRVFLKLSYIAPNPLFTEEIARQFTDEILPDEYQLYVVTLDPRLSVYVSCPAHSVWTLAATIDKIFNRFPTLSVIQEVFVSDIALLANTNSCMAEMKLDMIDNGVAAASELKFEWERKKAAITRQISLPSSIFVKNVPSMSKTLSNKW